MKHLATNNPGPSDYEKRAIKEIHRWKNPQLSWLGNAMKVINWPIDKATDLVTEVPGVEWVVEKAIGGLVSLLNDAAQWSVRPWAIYQEYEKNGHEISSPTHIHVLDLEDVDRTIGWLGAKYKSLALAEGAGSGYVGLPGIPADIVALVTLNQRAIGEYATYCGFDISSQQERLFAFNILALASSSTNAAKQMAMAQLVRIARDAAKKRAWRDLEKHAFVRVIRVIAKSLGIRLTKAKLAQVIPVTGAVIGGGFNAYYTTRTCDASYFLYRERFLAEKYGEDIIENSL